MKQIDTLLFDWDGTLLNSRDAVIDAVYHTAEVYVPGLFTREDLVMRFGESFDQFIEIVEESGDGSYGKGHILATYLEYANTNSSRSLQLFDGVAEELALLKQEGYALAIVTNKQRALAYAELERFEVAHYFQKIFTLDDVRAGKPEPDMLLAAMQALGSHPAHTLMIGDSEYDLLAAQAAGVSCAILDWHGPRDWQKAAPTYRCSRLSSLLQELRGVKTS